MPKAVLSIFLVAFAALTASGQVHLDAVHKDVLVTPPGVVTVVSRVTNSGISADTYSLSATLPDGWRLLSLRSQISLDPGASQIVILGIIPPETLLAGTYEVVLRAVSGGDSSIWDEVAIRLEVQAYQDVSLVAPPAGGASVPGTAVEYKFWVRNDGNIALVAHLVGTSRWTVTITPDLVNLLPGERVAVIVQHMIPNNALPGTTAVLAIEVLSSLYLDVFDRAVVVTSSLPLPPEAVETNLGLTLDVHALLSAELSEQGDLSSVLALRGFGEALGGDVTMSLSVADILGPTPLLGSWRCEHSSPNGTVILGDVSGCLGRFLDLSGCGLFLEFDTNDWGFAVLEASDASNGMSRAATLTFQDSTLRAAVGWEDMAGVEHAWSILTTSVDLLASRDWAFSVELASARQDHGQLGGAAALNATWSSANYETRLDLSWTNSPFPGQEETERRAETVFSHEMTLGGLSLWGAAGAGLGWDRTTGEIGWKRNHLELGSSSRINSAGPLLSLGALLEWTGSSTLPSPYERSDTKWIAAISHTWGDLSFGLSTQLGGTTDEINGIDVVTSLISGSVSLERNGYCTKISGMFAHSKEHDTEPAQSNQELSFAVQGTQDEDSQSATFSIERSDTGTVLSGTLVLGGFTVSVEMEGLAPKIVVEYEGDLQITIPWWRVKGQLRGRVYEDENSNQRPDPDEEGIPNLILALDSVLAQTNEDGEFLFPPLPAGTYSLAIPYLSSEYVLQARLPIPVAIHAGEITVMGIPVVRAARIAGRIAVIHVEQPLDEGLYLEGVQQPSSEGSLEPSRGLPGILVELSNGFEIHRQITDQTGNFQFEQLLPGAWVLTVLPEGIPAFHRLERESFEIHLYAGQYMELPINVYAILRPIEIIQEGELGGGGGE